MVSIEEYYLIYFKGEVQSCTIHTTACELLVEGTKCEACKKYICTFCSLHSRWLFQCKSDNAKQTVVSSHTSYCYLRTPQRKVWMSKLKAAINCKRKEVERLKCKLRESTEQHGIFVGKELEEDLAKIIKEKTMKSISIMPQIPLIICFGTSN